MRNKFFALVLIAAVVSVAGFLVWKHGTPYQDRYWSPNHEYYVQKYRNIGLPGLIGLPGHGSDAISGYIRLYRKDGALIHERYASFIRVVDPVWAGEKVYLRGIADMDRNPWTTPTPTSSELQRA